MASPQAKPVVRLIEAVRAASQQMHAITERTNRDFELSSALRDVLDLLYGSGSQTVPAMARTAGVSRQHVQQCVDRLAERGLVSARPNPAHRRSSLIVLTPAGARLMSGIGRHEKAILESLEAELQGEPVEAAVLVLTRFAAVLAGQELS
jgi:DNA-binding MarR family transcriptional regulator